MQYQRCCTSSNDERFTVPSGRRRTHVEPYQDFPVTHLQLYSTVSHPSLVPLLAELHLGNLCQLMQEADEQGNAGLIHLQPGKCRKSFALYYAWQLEMQWAASLPGLLCSILWSAHLILCTQPWEGAGQQCQHERAVPLQNKAFKHQTLNPSHSALGRCFRMLVAPWSCHIR